VEIHRVGQAKGIDYVFTDYRIRVGSIVRDYSLTERGEAPKDSNKRHQK